jgi:GNAT superfamily N-acetyltransferase
MTITRATLTDVETITTHRRAIFFETGYRDERQLNDMCAGFRPWLRSRISTQEYLGWFVVDPEGKVVSGLGLWLMDWPAHVIGPGLPRANILNVYTRPESRRQGMARALIVSALEWCRDHRIPRIRLNATEQARGLYQSLGFQPTNEMQLRI